LPSQSKSKFYYNTTFFFISLSLVLESLIHFFNFITLLADFINNIFELGWSAFIPNDFVVIINFIYIIILIGAAIYFYYRMDLNFITEIIVWLILFFSLIKNPYIIFDLINFFNVIFGRSPIVYILPSYWTFYYLLYWWLEGIIGIVLLGYVIISGIFLGTKKRSKTNFIKYLQIFLELFLVITIFKVIFDLVFSILALEINLYAILQGVLFIFCIIFGILFLRFNLKNNHYSLRKYLGKLIFILLGIWKILQIFNVLIIESSEIIVLNVILGITLSIIGVLFKENIIFGFQNN